MGETGGHAAPARVLVVDDEPSLRLLCRVNLELDGFEVLEASTLAEARSALSTGEVAVVLLDLHLHGERGGELIAECRSRRPPVGVVVVSGSTAAGEELPPGVDATLPKPFELDELLAAVRALAGARAGR